MTPEPIRPAVADARVAPLVRVLRDGTDEQVASAYCALIVECGPMHGHYVWAEAMRLAHPDEEETL